MNAHRVKLTPSGFPCWRCGTDLMHVEPAIDGWKYHCGNCQHLTSPAHQLETAMRDKPAGALGIVTAVPCRILPVKAEAPPAREGGAS